MKFQPSKLINHQNDTCGRVVNRMRYRREIRDIKNINEWESRDLSSTLYLPIYARISVDLNNLKKRNENFYLF